MNNIRQFSSKEDIQEQACLWISRLDRGLNSDEKTELDAWLSESNAHRQALLDAASLWDDMSVLNELSGLFPSLPHVSRRKNAICLKQRFGALRPHF